VVGRLVREIERKANGLSAAVRQVLGGVLGKAQRIADQSRSRKNTSGASKLYAWHAPEVECIAKGKSRTPYEFGVKVGIVATLKHNLIVGARAFTGNPYDGHTLSTQLGQAAILMQDTGVKPATAYVDLGYRGVDADNPGVAIKHRGKYKTLTTQERKLLKRMRSINRALFIDADEEHGLGYEVGSTMFQGSSAS
jgi:IS5 family transposase